MLCGGCCFSNTQQSIHLQAVVQVAECQHADLSTLLWAILVFQSNAPAAVNTCSPWPIKGLEV